MTSCSSSPTPRTSSANAARAPMRFTSCRSRPTSSRGPRRSIATISTIPGSSIGSWRARDACCSRRGRSNSATPSIAFERVKRVFGSGASAPPRSPGGPDVRRVRNASRRRDLLSRPCRDREARQGRAACELLQGLYPSSRYPQFPMPTSGEARQALDAARIAQRRIAQIRRKAARRTIVHGTRTRSAVSAAGALRSGMWSVFSIRSTRHFLAAARSA